MIISKQPHLEISTASDPGVSGKQNEDRFQICSCQLSPKDKTPSLLAVLCDGIGGHKSGEIAAQMGVSIITETILESDGKQPLEIIERAVGHASQAIYQTSLSEQGHSGMGATTAIAWVIGSRLYTANLGDSRIYLLRDNHIIQLTTDHTWIQEAYEAGIISKSDRENHPNAHVIRRYLGSKNTPKPDFRMWYFEGETDSDARRNQGIQLKAGDKLLLCSDGLTDLVGDHEIQEVIQNNSSNDAVNKLIGLANERGGHDNITVILMKAPSKGVFKKQKYRRFLLGCLILLLAISAITTAFLLGWRWWQNRLGNMELPTPNVTGIIPQEEENFAMTETSSPEDTLTPTIEPSTGFATQGPTITPWPTNTKRP